MSRRIFDELSKFRRHVRSMAVVYRGEPVSKDDKMKLYLSIELTATLIEDCLPSGLVPVCRNIYFSRFYNISTIDCFDFGNDVKALATGIRRLPELLEADPGLDWKHFTRACSLSKGNYFSFLKEPFEYFTKTKDVQTFSGLLQLSDFSSKINFDSVDIKDLMIEEYNQAESDMTSWKYPGDILNELSYIIAEWFDAFDPGMGIPMHGPGASREVSRAEASPITKEEAGTVLDWDTAEIPICGVPLVDHLYRTIYVDDRSWKCCRLEFVPKSMVTNRVISKEPYGLMYAQQSLKDDLYDYFKRDPQLRRIIDLEHQELSSNLAMLGSKDGSYASIDLSAASDSVTARLVYRVFSRVPELRDQLMLLRSIYCDYVNDDYNLRWRMNKYAPMGSALCFPVEVIIFAAVCELGRRNSGYHKLFRVYGDDIVCPTCYVQEVLELLSALHFTVNVKKSHWNTGCLRFREACGGEYLNGFEVTPVHMSRGYKAPTQNSSLGAIFANCGLVNQLTAANRMLSRSYLLRHMQVSLPTRLFKAIIRFDDRLREDYIDAAGNAAHRYASAGIYQPAGSTENREMRFNSDLQRLEYLTIAYQKRGRTNRDSSAHDSVSYHVWLRDRYLNRNQKLDTAVFGRESMKLRPETVAYRTEKQEYKLCLAWQPSPIKGEMQMQG